MRMAKSLLVGKMTMCIGSHKETLSNVEKYWERFCMILEWKPGKHKVCQKNGPRLLYKKGNQLECPTALGVQSAFKYIIH